MPYTNLINKIISSRNLTTNDILKEFEKIGVKYTRSHINKVINGNCKIPSEDFSKAIAKICKIDESILLLESSFDKCDKIIQNCLYEIIYNGLIFSQNILSDFSFNNIETTSLLKKLETMPISELIIKILDNKININELNYKSIKTENNKIQFDFSEVFEYTMIDNSMAPLIKKNDKFKVEIKENYEDMDIVYLYIEEKEQNTVRRVIFKDDKVILYPENNLFNKEIYNKGDVQILARVTEIMRKI